MVKQISDLQGYWKLNGNSIDSSIIGNNGTDTAITYTPGIISESNAINDAASFNGTTSKIVITPTAIDIQSVSFWINANSNTRDVIKLSGSAKITYDGNGDIVTTGLTNATIYVNLISTSPAVALSTWTQVIVTFDSITSSAIELGHETTFFDGLLQDVRVFDRSLSGAERSAIYIGGLGNSTNNLTRVIYEEPDDGVLGDDVVISSMVDLTDDTEIDSTQLALQPTLSISPGEETAFLDEDLNLAFLGLARELVLQGVEGDVRRATIRSYEIQLQDRLVNDIFENISPEDLIELMVTTFSDMTFVSNFTSGLIIIRYDARGKKNAWDVVKDVLDRLTNVTYHVDTAKVFTLFERSSISSPLQLINGTSTIIDGWEQDTSKQVTRLQLIGGTEIIEKVELQDGTGSQAIFNLAEIPSTIKVEVDSGGGFVEQDIIVDGSTTAGVYTLVAKKKTVTFEAGDEPSSGTKNVRLTYLFEIPVSVEYDAEPQVQDEFGIIEKPLTKQWLNQMDDARGYAQTYVDTFSPPILHTRGNQIETLVLTGLVPGYSIFVEDLINEVDGKNISRNFTIKRVLRDMPKNGLIIEVGENRNRLIDNFKQNEYDVTQLYEQNSNSQIVQKSQILRNGVNVLFTVSLPQVIRRTFIEDCFYLENDGGGDRNQMLNDGTGPTMRNSGCFTDTPIEFTFITTEGGDQIITEGGDNLIIED